MKLYDISQTIEEQMVVYKNKEEKRPQMTMTRSHDSGGVRESRVSLDVHTGTHLDAPLHMQKEGIAISEMGIEPFISLCKVFDLSDVSESIGREELVAYCAQSGMTIEHGDVLLLKTKNSFDTDFNSSFVYLNESGALYLSQRGVKGVGIDALGIERNQPGHPTHHHLFNAGIYILEGLVLKDIEPKHYELIALPLKLKGLDASPVRAVLREI